MQSKQSRRAIITSAALPLLLTTGCLSDRVPRGEAESLTIDVANETTTARTVTVRLTTSGGSTDFERTEEISPDDVAEFRLEDPATEYTLITEVESGLSKSEKWNVTACTGAMYVEIHPDRIGYIYSAC